MTLRHALVRSLERICMSLLPAEERFLFFFYQGPVFFNKLNAFICDAPPYICSYPELKTFFLPVIEFLT